MSQHDAGIKAAMILKLRAGERYAAVIHLSNKDAAHVLGVTVGSVQSYRRTRPEARQIAPQTQDDAKPSVDSLDQTSRYKGPPRRSAEVCTLGAITGYTTTARVSVAREPWSDR